MEVILKEKVLYRDRWWDEGQTLDLPDRDAERLIEEGKAVPGRVVIEVHDFTQEFSCV